ncbi:zinc metalloprotease [Streptomyces sp. NPDC047117]|uniref:zinc metalloprotease n=1 Tax=Streptomyces sp. NPDC047117 TaxID=3155379 RepID=UPI0033FC8722
MISKDTTTDGGNIPDSQINAQIDVLNADFSSTGLTFTLAGVSRTVNPDWYSNAGPGSTQERAMKRALRKGGAATLNVYSLGRIPTPNGNLLGHGTFPADYLRNPSNDGVLLLFSTLPGSSLAPYNLGRTLSSETGHWTGLYNAFQGGCTPPGDYVADTPAMAKAFIGCPVGRNSCPKRPGLDPIRFCDGGEAARGETCPCGCGDTGLG